MSVMQYRFREYFAEQLRHSYKSYLLVVSRNIMTQPIDLLRKKEVVS